ncbi:ADP-ribosylation factor 3 [Tupaia chinensis]|uniref:ADP-ribosylation factor 3 n=1 Tax=Tupaia chinensis TaxID=246437 RepID=L9KR35_TUPCH|nr:ADP-ribosylation factor 3 [Tupaia chinensis]
MLHITRAPLCPPDRDVNSVLLSLQRLCLNCGSLKTSTKVPHGIQTWRLEEITSIVRWKSEQKFSWIKVAEEHTRLGRMADSNDRKRVIETCQELMRRLAKDKLSDAFLPAFVNKQDLPRAMSMAKNHREAGAALCATRNWYIQATCSTGGPAQ